MTKQLVNYSPNIHEAFRSRHEILAFRACEFGDGGHYHGEGYNRAVCTCGWKSAPSTDIQGLVALFTLHLAENRSEAEIKIPLKHGFSAHITVVVEPVNASVWSVRTSVKELLP